MKTRRALQLTFILAILALTPHNNSHLANASAGSSVVASQPLLVLSAPFNHTGWTKARTITLDNTLGESNLTDYQAKLNITFSLAMEPDFRDLRFVDNTNSLLPYWIDSEADGSYATLYVRVPFIPSHASTNLTMYYGNPYATPASDGQATFDLFDDFEYTDNPSNHGWVQVHPATSNATTDTSHHRTGSRSLFTKGSDTPGANEKVRALAKYDLPIRNDLILEGYFYHNSTNNMIERISLQTNNNATTYTIGASTPDGVSGSIPRADSEYYWRQSQTCCGSATGISFKPNQWNSFKLVKTLNSIQGFLLDLPVGPAITDRTQVSQVFIGGDNATTGVGAQPWWFDDIRVRKYTLVEPTAHLESERPAGPSESALFTVPSGTNKQVEVGRTLSTLNLTLTLNSTRPVELLVTRLSTSPVGTPSSLSPLGVFFKIAANQTVDARIRLYYTQSEAQAVDQNTLAPYTYNSNTGQWVPLESVSRDTAARWVEGTVHHFSLFGVFSQLVSHAVPATTCWYCAWWLWAGVGTAGAAGTGVFYRRNRRSTSRPTSINNPVLN